MNLYTRVAYYIIKKLTDIPSFYGGVASNNILSIGSKQVISFFLSGKI